MEKKKYCNIGSGLVRLDFTRVKPSNIKERNIENRRDCESYNNGKANSVGKFKCSCRLSTENFTRRCMHQILDACIYSYSYLSAEDRDVRVLVLWAINMLDKIDGTHLNIPAVHMKVP